MSYVQVEFSAGSLNTGDVFVLDAGTRLFQYNGTEAGAWEKHTAKGIMDNIRSSRSRGTIDVSALIPVIIDDGGTTEECKGSCEFWKVIGGTAKDVKLGHKAGDDCETKAQRPNALCHVTDKHTGEVVIHKIAEGKDIKKSMLDSTDSFILDTPTEVFVWVGSKVSKKEQREAMVHAEEYLCCDRSPHWTVPICVLYENDRNPPLCFQKAFS